MLKIAVIEDEKEQQNLLRGYLQRYGSENCERFFTSFFYDCKSFFQCVVHFDIILLDICLNEDPEGGLAVARYIRQHGENTIICFLTNMAQFAIQGYDVQAQTFLVKPIVYSALSRQLDIAIQKIKGCKSYTIMLPMRGNAFCVNVSDILFVETLGRGLCVHTKATDMSCSETMKSMEQQLKNKAFFRCHSSFLVNLHFVTRVQGLEAIVAGHSVPISRHRKKEFMDALSYCLGEDIK
ncbi:MAG: response regulator transcription factor [Bacilli bacterium]|nr:response regulator transcription factor [Bacilli bacterium]